MLRAVHYFGDTGVANFWTTFADRAVPADFERIRSDGFNAIILVLPWAAFQPGLSPISYSDRHLGRLRWLIDQAAGHDLRVILRVGYLWERDEVPISTRDRYRMMLRTGVRADAPVSNAWVDYHRKLAPHATGIEFALLSWEDAYWPMLRGPTERDLETRRGISLHCGFAEYARKVTARKLPKALAGSFDAESGSAFEVPRRDEPLYALWLRFFDHVILNRLVALAAPAWGETGLRFEHRVDRDRWVDADRRTRHYPYSLERPGVSGHVIYYHPNMGELDQRQMDRAAALAQLEGVLRTASDCSIDGQPPFVDQFNFTHSHPAYQDWSTIADEDLAAFLRGSAELFRRYTSGYGLWGYRDWIDDKVSNGRFLFGTDSWVLRGCRPTAAGLEVEAGATFAQTISGPRMRRVYAEIDVAAVNSPLELFVTLGDEPRVIHADQSGRFALQLVAPVDNPTLELTVAKGAGTIERVALYSHTYTNGVYTRNWEERPTVLALRALNASLGDEARVGAPS
jgi:hypothetical protein